MDLISSVIRVRSEGHGDTLDLTPALREALAGSGLEEGQALLFVPGSTASLTTIEFEPGAVADFGRLFEEIAARGREYRHHLTWGDDNGHSHVRAALLGPDLTVPFIGGRLCLGTWQQVILVDFDTRPRNRELVLQLTGR